MTKTVSSMPAANVTARLHETLLAKILAALDRSQRRKADQIIRRYQHLIDDTAVNKIGVMTDNVARELHVALVSCESMAKMTVVSADRVLPNLRRDLVRLESRDLQSSGPAGQDPKAVKARN
ncbi:MAG TPA: hypothetical protein VFN63_09450 [Pseudolabrys sp.]|nr:hypothetical protein [Pseudolabrys sp.]